MTGKEILEDATKLALGKIVALPITPPSKSKQKERSSKLTEDNLAAHDKAIKCRHENLPNGLTPKTGTVMATVGGKGKDKEREKKKKRGRK